MRYWISLGLLVGLVLLLDIGQRIHMITLGYEIEQLVKVQRDVQRLNKELIIEKETLSAPDRIERIAMESLGMKIPDDGQVIYVGILRPNDRSPEPGSKMTLVRK